MIRQVRLCHAIATAAALAGAACSGDAPSTAGDGGIRGRLAIVSSDFQASTSVSLFDPDTSRLTRDRCFDSGSAPAQLSAVLSGDAALPSSPQPGGELLVIDRSNAALTWIDASTCTPLRQLSVATGFASNPQDVLALSPTKAYVSRYRRNLAATSDPSDFDEGDDLLIIDPSVPKIVGRIDLAAFAAPAGSTTVEARPTRAVAAGGLVYIALDSLDPMFAAQGEGRLAIVDPTRDQVIGTVPLPGLKNCSAPALLPSGEQLLVACNGFFGDDAVTQLAASALAVVSLSTTPAAMTRTIPAGALGGGPLTAGALAILDDQTVFAATMGRMEGGGLPALADMFFRVTLADGSSRKLMEATAYSLGLPAADPESGKVFLPGSDGQGTVSVFDATTTDTGPIATFAASPATGLPPRQIGRY